MQLDNRNKLQGDTMSLKLVFKIFAGFGVFFAMSMLLAPDAMMASYGMTLSGDDSRLLVQFLFLIQLTFSIVVWQLPGWLGDDLAKAGPTFMVLPLLFVAMNIFHVITDVLPASGAQIMESGVWVVFAGLFYFYSKKSA